MKASKHTPGAWLSRPGSAPHYQGQVYSETSGVTLAVTYGDGEEGANARLMAAAPELLDALQLIAAHYDDLRKSNPGFMGKLCLQDYGLWNQALLAMERSLAKATGRA